MKNEAFLYLILASEIISIFLMVRLWTSKDYLLFKVLLTVILIMPLIGPIFFIFMSSIPSPQENRLQNRAAKDTNLWGWGKYTDDWQYEKKRMEKRLNELKAASEESKNETKE